MSANPVIHLTIRIPPRTIRGGWSRWCNYNNTCPTLQGKHEYPTQANYLEVFLTESVQSPLESSCVIFEDGRFHLSDKGRALIAPMVRIDSNSA